MMRSLWTAAAGMTSQQLNVDTISNNLANVNTTGYKKERVEFKTLLYETMEGASLDQGSTVSQKPVNLQMGHGVKPVATSRMFSPGSLERTENTFDFAIEGNGFFVVDMGDGSIGYTKDGNLKLSVNDNVATLTTSDGFQILNVDGDPIEFPENINYNEVKVDSLGNISYIDENKESQNLNSQIDVVQFTNVQGLEAIGNNLFVTTVASGEPIQESSGDINKISNIVQQYLERSNVQVAEEMVNLIVAQRAYELNSKSIQTSDDMLQQANNLKR